MRAPSLLLLMFVVPGALAATRTVTDAGDAGDGTCDASCTLRDALTGVQADDRILFDLALPNPLQLSLTGPALQVSVPLRITANDGVPTTLKRTAATGRLLEILDGGDVRIVGLGFESGTIVGIGLDAEGGAVRVAEGGALELRQCVFRNNNAVTNAVLGTPGFVGTARGGAIAARGDLIVDGCTFVENGARGGAGFPSTVLMIPGMAGGSGYGGAIHAAGAIDVLNSTFTGNVALGGDGGTGGPGPGGPLPGGNGGNGGSSAGGALFFAATATPTVAFSTLSANSVVAGAGGSGGSGAPSGNPGTAVAAALASDAPATINTSVIAGNGDTQISGCAGPALTQRTTNRVDDAGCPGVTVNGLMSQFAPIDTAATVPVYRPLLGSIVIDTSPDCLDALGVELVDLDQLLDPRPLFGGITPGQCDFGAIEFDVVSFADGFEDPPPPP